MPNDFQLTSATLVGSRPAATIGIVPHSAATVALLVVSAKTVLAPALVDFVVTSLVPTSSTHHLRLLPRPVVTCQAYNNQNVYRS